MSIHVAGEAARTRLVYSERGYLSREGESEWSNHARADPNAVTFLERESEWSNHVRTDPILPKLSEHSNGGDTMVVKG